MTFNYNTNIPAANNDPSDDQPLMRENTNSISNLIAVDHVGFGNLTGGQHNKVTYPDVNPQGPQTDPASVMYTQAGSESNFSQLAYRNQGGAFPLNLIKAYGVYTYTSGSPGTIAPFGSQNFNITTPAPTAVRLSATAREFNFTIDVAQAGIPNSNIGVLVSPQASSAAFAFTTSYRFTNPTLTLSFITSAPSFPATMQFTFIVLQV